MTEFVLEDSTRWILNNYELPKELESSGKIIELPSTLSIGQSVNVYSSRGAAIKVSSKCKSVLFESCHSMGLIVGSPIISGIEIINSVKCQIQLEAGVSVPSLNVDSCEEITIFLTKSALEAIQIYTSKSSQVRIQLLDGEESEAEFIIPEQFITTLQGGKMKTVPLEHAGA